MTTITNMTTEGTITLTMLKVMTMITTTIMDILILKIQSLPGFSICSCPTVMDINKPRSTPRLPQTAACGH